MLLVITFRKYITSRARCVRACFVTVQRHQATGFELPWSAISSSSLVVGTMLLMISLRSCPGTQWLSLGYQLAILLLKDSPMLPFQSCEVTLLRRCETGAMTSQLYCTVAKAATAGSVMCNPNSKALTHSQLLLKSFN